MGAKEDVLCQNYDILMPFIANYKKLGINDMVRMFLLFN
ncbi:hypothetical protein IWQ47_004312 [Aquimarina sp. EL_43]|nr:hypothetical protein [Aquimarina sp. EL_35]MBG6153065.1 hypothetical protein [Aquimarina sp. EL_32]MBG6171221.1 hypothetical protein [Aquimarina sp. EL_43]